MYWRKLFSSQFSPGRSLSRLVRRRTISHSSLRFLLRNIYALKGEKTVSYVCNRKCKYWLSMGFLSFHITFPPPWVLLLESSLAADGHSIPRDPTHELYKEVVQNSKMDISAKNLFPIGRTRTPAAKPCGTLTTTHTFDWLHTSTKVPTGPHNHQKHLLWGRRSSLSAGPLWVMSLLTIDITFLILCS